MVSSNFKDRIVVDLIGGAIISKLHLLEPGIKKKQYLTPKTINFSGLTDPVRSSCQVPIHEGPMLQHMPHIRCQSHPVSQQGGQAEPTLD